MKAKGVIVCTLVVSICTDAFLFVPQIFFFILIYQMECLQDGWDKAFNCFDNILMLFFVIRLQQHVCLFNEVNCRCRKG